MDRFLRQKIEVEVESLLEETAQGASTLMDLLKMGDDRLLYRFPICILLQLFQQMSGGNLISVYSSVIFEQGLRLDAETARILSGGMITWKLLSCFVLFFTIDRFGRRIALMVSGAGMASCMLGSGNRHVFPPFQLRRADHQCSVHLPFHYNWIHWSQLLLLHRGGTYPSPRRHVKYIYRKSLALVCPPVYSNNLPNI